MARKKDSYAKALLATSQQINKHREIKMLESATLLFIAAIALALMDKHGFGKKRLEKTLIEVCQNIKAVNDDRCSLEDMLNTITKETGLDIREILSRGLEDKPVFRLDKEKEKEV